jgi:ParB-like chromosome segregation protein Spo0J
MTMMSSSAEQANLQSELGAGRLQVDYRPVSALIPFAKNARTHSERQVAEIAASIREVGWTNPILVDGENGVIAGHGRLLAARKLGMQEVPVIELSGLSEAQKRALIIADNKLALNAG